MTAPTSLSSEFSDEKICTTCEWRIVFLLARSCTLLACRRFRCDGGKSRYAIALGSASSSPRAAPLQHLACHYMDTESEKPESRAIILVSFLIFNGGGDNGSNKST